MLSADVPCGLRLGPPGYFPYGEDPRYDRNALNTVAEDLTENPDQPFDVASTSLCDDLAQM